MAFPNANQRVTQTRMEDGRQLASPTPKIGGKNGATSLSTSQRPLTKEELRESKPWAHLVGGALGGMVSATLTSPLDVLKTRLQSDFYQNQITATRAARHIPPPSSLSYSRAALLHFRETFQVLFSIHKIEGWRALFRGLGPTLVGVVPASAIKFYTYGNAKRIISEDFNHGKEAVWVHLSAGIIAGVAVGTATNPIWVLRTRLQLDKTNAERSGTRAVRQYKNSLDCAMQTVRAEGIRGLYRGLTASYLGVSESTLQWVLYEQMNTYLKRRERRLVEAGKTPTAADDVLSWMGKMGFAGSSKFFAAMITYPHEVVRTRLRQAPTQNGQLKYRGLVQTFKTVFREEGMAAFYGGLTPHLIRVVPNTAIMFGT